MKRIKNKNHTFISINAENVFEKIQHPCIIKTQQTRNRMKYLDIIKAIYGKPTANITLKGEKLKAFPQSLGTWWIYLSSLLQLHIVLEFSARAISQDKETKAIQIRKEEINYFCIKTTPSYV